MRSTLGKFHFLVWALAIMAGAVIVPGSLVSTCRADTALGTESFDPGTEPGAGSPGNQETPGVVIGHVRALEDGSALPYTNILAYRHRAQGEPEFVGGSLAITGGQFVVRLVPGTYDLVFQYIGRDPGVLKDVEITPGGRIERDVQLKVKPIILENGFQPVTAMRITTSENAALQRQRKAAAVQDALTKEQINRTGDSDAAAAVARVSGVSVVGRRYVFVRGLGDRYSTTLLNGSMLGSPEPNKRTVPMDIFPTTVFDNIVIQKTFTPDMNGEFGGGVIDIATADYVGRMQFSHSISVGMSTNAVRRSFLSYQGGGSDWWGVDDGTRAIPDPVLEASEGQNLIFGPYSTEELVDLRRSFTNVWRPQGEEYSPNLSYSGTFATGAQFLGARWGVLGSLTQKNKGNSKDRKEVVREGGGDIRTDYDVLESVRETLGGATASLSMLAGPNKAKLNLLYTRSSDDIARISSGPNNDWSVDQARIYQLAWVERTMKSAALTGDHADIFGTSLTWRGAYSEAERLEPDRREVTYEATTVDDPLGLSTRSQYPYTRIYGESMEESRSAQADWRIPVSAKDALKFDIKVGVAWWERERATSYRRFGYKCRSFTCRLQRELFLLPPEEILEADSITESWIVEETTRDDDAYSGTHEVIAQYAMADVKLADRLRIVGGVRWEDSRQNVATFNDDAQPGAGDPLQIDKRTQNPLPALNATWSFNDKMNLRGTYSRTLNRPQLRELTPLKIYNYETGWFTTGNPDLVQAEITAYDLRWEYFPAMRQYLSLSLFYKDLDRPIELAVKPDVANYNEIPVNVDRGKLRGAELEFRSSLDGLWHLIRFRSESGDFASPSLADRLTFSFNYSWVESETTASIEGGGTRTRPLTGQADNSINLGLFYNGDRHGISLLWRDFGTRLSGLGLGTLPDVYENPPAELDFTWRWYLGRGFTARLVGQNLLDRTVTFTQGDTVVRSWKPGREISIALGWTLQ